MHTVKAPKVNTPTHYFMRAPRAPRFFNTFDEDPAPPADPQDAPPPKPDAPAPKDMMSKSEVDKLLAAEKENGKKLMQEMELLKTRSTMTKEERAAQDKRLAELENKLLTTEEMNKREKNKLEKQRLESEQALSKQRDHWQNLYTNERIVRSIKDAALEHEAISPEQMVALLSSKTKLIETKNEVGDVTGYEVIASIEDRDKDGKSFIAELPISKALANMKEQAHNFNLFKSSLKSGFGTNQQRMTIANTTEAQIAKDRTAWKAHSQSMRGKNKGK